jgi:hypothetical protein
MKEPRVETHREMKCPVSRAVAKKIFLPIDVGYSSCITIELADRSLSAFDGLGQFFGS